VEGQLCRCEPLQCGFARGSENTELSDAELKNIIAQARFLRGHYYFELKRMYNMVPWIDENTTDFSSRTTRISGR
jgi:hypothetical protein